MTSTAEQDDFLLVTPSPSQPTLPVPFQTPTLNGHNVYELTVSQLQYHYSSKNFSISQYTGFCIDRITATNPYLEAVIEVNPDALSVAKALDSERLTSNGKGLGMMHGVPVLVKDTMATADRMQTTGGSWALLGCKVPKDAFIISRLRAGGAIILGKTNLDKWAGMRGNVYSCGFTARGGQTRNPYILSRSPSGSSSGSAVTVSANVVPLSFGTETDTSIVGPALVCGVIGIKPTVGLTSRTGIIPISCTQDSIGPYGRTVADAAIALDCIAAPDPEDESTIVEDREQPFSFTSCLTDRLALKGAKFGLPIYRFWDLAPYPQRATAERVLALIQQAGTKIVPVNLPCAEERIHPDGHWDWERYGETHPERSEITVSKVQTYFLMKEYLSQLSNTPMKGLEDIVRFNDENNGSEAGLGGLPAWMDGQDLFRKCVETKGIKDETYWKALKWIRKQTREKGIDAALKHEYVDEYGEEKEEILDALLFCDIKMAGTSIAAQAGYPVVALPIGIDLDGMPVGLTIQHGKWEDGRCVKWASAIEDLLMYENEQLRTAMDDQESDDDQRRQKTFGRVPPTYREHLRKNIPVEYSWRYKGAPKYNVVKFRSEGEKATWSEQ